MRRSLLDTVKGRNEKDAKHMLLNGCYTDLDEQSDRKDGTVLYWSCCMGFKELVRLLLLRGADVNTCTCWGASPLHAAVDQNRWEIVAVLLQSGANVNQQTNNGDTPCHLAAYRGHEHCVQQLCTYGADIQVRNKKGRTPVQEAYGAGQQCVYRYLCAILPLVRRSISAEYRSAGPCSIQLSECSSIPRVCKPAPTEPSSFCSSDLSPYTSFSSYSTSPTSPASLSSQSEWSESDSESIPEVFPRRTIYKAQESPIIVPRSELDGGCLSDDDNSSLNDLSSLLSSATILTRPPLTFRNI